MPETIDQLVEGWNNDAVIIHRDELPKYILEAFAANVNDIEDIINEIEDGHFIADASNDELERLGSHLDVNRKPNEGDEDLRQRITLAYLAAASDTTYGDFEKVVLAAFDNGVTIDIHSDYPLLLINTTLDVLDATVPSAEEIVRRLEYATQSNHGVQLTAEGTFELGGYLEGERISEDTVVNEPTSFAQPLTIDATLTMNATTTLENKTYIPPEGSGLNDGTLGTTVN